MTTNMNTNAPASRAITLLIAAWVLALAASLAVLFIGEILGQTPCHLCWFQRAFMFPLAVILGVAAWRSGFMPHRLPHWAGLRAVSLAAVRRDRARTHNTMYRERPVVHR